MTANTKDAARVVALIRRQLDEQQRRLQYSAAEEADRLTAAMPRLLYLTRMIRHADRRGYTGAGRRLNQRFERQLDELAMALRRWSATRPTPRPLPTPRALIDELDQLEDEFGGWAYDHRKRQLSVTTEPITLEEVPLGPFRIALELTGPAFEGPGTLAFYIEALDPNPAAGHEHVTHPHVSDQRLCAGDAVAPINAALASGRITDCFILIRTVLRTYNRESPYAPLEDWHHGPCPDCGDAMHPDHRVYCPDCERELCDGCTGGCARCDESVCLGCLVPCDFCNHSVCSNCKVMCRACGEEVCTRCSRRCDDCRHSLCPDCLTPAHESGVPGCSGGSTDSSVAGAPEPDDATLLCPDCAQEREEPDDDDEPHHANHDQQQQQQQQQQPETPATTANHPTQPRGPGEPVATEPIHHEAQAGEYRFPHPLAADRSPHG